FYFAGSRVLEDLTRLFGEFFGQLHTTRLRTVNDAAALISALFRSCLLLLAPMVLPLLVAGVAGNILQIGFEIHAEPLAPKLSKLNPLAGLKRIVSMRGLVELVKSLVKVLFIGAIAWSVVSGYLADFPTLVRRDIAGIWEFTHTAAYRILFYVCLATVVLAVLDYAYQRWQHEENLKMTKQEIRDERKQTEGDPQIKSRIRSLQRQAAYHRMIAEVPTADVVITNPTHLAIALRFDSAEMNAPQVVAKGADYLAARIRDIAREHGVPLVENQPLAQSLYRLADPGDYIPVELYRAVAEVLAYVYRLKGRYAV
ncbi:MAG TPA: flagellar biosynthesis protein FlhB, partial [Desulfobacterales bacterium]|nr:flagellar biosynthesis protein FlhB [Desulfobacterales bacterium]